MDRRELIENMTDAVIGAMRGERSDIWTAVPAILQSFDSVNITCSVQPAQMVMWDIAGVMTPVKLPILVDVPVQFPGGGGYAMTFPLTIGDEGLVVFASRSIDSWWGYGEVLPPQQIRMHDLSDGFFIPCVYSKPRAALMGGVNATNVEIRNRAKTETITLGATGINITSSVEVNLTAPSVNLGKSAGALSLLMANFLTLFNSHTHVAPSGGGTTSAPAQQADSTYATTLTKGA